MLKTVDFMISFKCIGGGDKTTNLQNVFGDASPRKVFLVVTVPTKAYFCQYNANFNVLG